MKGIIFFRPKSSLRPKGSISVYRVVLVVSCLCKVSSTITPRPEREGVVLRPRHPVPEPELTTVWWSLTRASPGANRLYSSFTLMLSLMLPREEKSTCRFSLSLLPSLKRSTPVLLFRTGPCRPRSRLSNLSYPIRPLTYQTSYQPP